MPLDRNRHLTTRSFSHDVGIPRRCARGARSRPVRPFGAPLDPAILRVAAGCYTIWEAGDQYLYAGMAGRGMTAAAVTAARANSRGRVTGLRNRLASHQNGGRSGDQFCVYVFDLFVVPNLTSVDIEAVGRCERRFDDDVRTYVQDHFSYRWYETEDAKTAFDLERHLVTTGLRGSPPFINPGRPEP
jgi:hypothetical protein